MHYTVFQKVVYYILLQMTASVMIKDCENYSDHELLKKYTNDLQINVLSAFMCDF